MRPCGSSTTSRPAERYTCWKRRRSGSSLASPFTRSSSSRHLSSGYTSSAVPLGAITSRSLPASRSTSRNFAGMLSRPFGSIVCLKCPRNTFPPQAPQVAPGPALNDTSWDFNPLRGTILVGVDWGCQAKTPDFQAIPCRRECHPLGGGPDRPTAGGRRPRVGRSGALLGGAVVRQGLRHPALDLLDAGLLGRVRRQPLRRPLALGRLGHPLPQLERGVGVVAGLGHQDETDVIGLRLLLAAPRQQPAHLGPRAERRAHQLNGGRVAARHTGQELRRGLHAHLLAEPLAAVARQHVADL